MIMLKEPNITVLTGFKMIYTKVCLIWFKLVSFLFSSEGESNVGELLKAKADEGVKVKK